MDFLRQKARPLPWKIAKSWRCEIGKSENPRDRLNVTNLRSTLCPFASDQNILYHILFATRMLYSMFNGSVSYVCVLFHVYIKNRISADETGLFLGLLLTLVAFCTSIIYVFRNLIHIQFISTYIKNE